MSRPVWLKLPRSNWIRTWIILLAAAASLGAAGHLYWTQTLARRAAEARFMLVGPQGAPLVVQLPELARVPPLDLAAACALVARENADLRDKRKYVADNPAQAAILEGAIRTAVETGCRAGGPYDFRFYDQLGDALAAPTQDTLADAFQLAAGRREALRRATTASDVGRTLHWIGVQLDLPGERLQAPDLLLIAAEALGLRVSYCGGDARESADCRTQWLRRRDDDLAEAGRLRAAAGLLRGR